MEFYQIPELFMLDITVLSNDRNKEVLLTPPSRPELPVGQEKQVIIWTRKKDLTDRVHVEESPEGRLRVVKRVAWENKPRSRLYSELAVMEALSRLATTQREHFVEFLGWFPVPNSSDIRVVMEYCSLGDISKCYSNPLPEVTTRSVCEQLLEALSTMHGLGITHRDVKPQNVLVVKESPIWIKLADFGISKMNHEGNTELRTNVGTDGYIAPEIYSLVDDWREDSSYTTAVDIWSLGCLLYYILIRRTPFPTFLSLQAYAERIASFPDRPLLQKGVSPGGRALIQRFLMLSPDDRPKASKELLKDWIIGETAISAQDLIPDIERDGDSDISSDLLQFPSGGNGSTIPEGSSNGPLFPPKDHMDMVSYELWCFVNETVSFIQNIRSSAPTTRLNGWGFRRWVVDCANSRKSSAYVERMIKADKLPQPDMDRLQTLLENGANPNKLHDGYTALHLATIKGYREWVLMLLRYGADMTIRTERFNKRTVLHLAIVDLRLEHPLLGSRMVDFLLEHGADPDIPDKDGRTLLHHAVRMARSASQMKPALDLITTLKSQGVSLTHKDNNGHTALGFAVALKCKEASILLLEYNSEADTVDLKGRTLVHLAIERPGFPDLGLLKRVIEAGANVNQRDSRGYSPLWVAANNGMGSKVINLLIDHGAHCEFDDEDVMRRIRHAKKRREV